MSILRPILDRGFLLPVRGLVLLFIWAGLACATDQLDEPNTSRMPIAESDSPPSANQPRQINHNDEKRRPDPAGLYEDFTHLILIAKPNLAVIAGEALLQSTTDDELREVIQPTGRRPRAHLPTRSDDPDLQEVLNQIHSRLSKDPKRE